MNVRAKRQSWITASIIILFLAVLSLPLTADDPALEEDLKDDVAQEIFTGKVLGVYSRTTKKYKLFRVEILVSSIEKGTMTKKNRVAYIGGKHKVDSGDFPTTAGTENIPADGDKVRVRAASDSHGILEALPKSGFETLKK